MESVTSTPVSVNAAAISPTVASGLAELSTATAPAPWGDAIDVPLLFAKPPPGTADTMPTPGASVDRKDAVLAKSAMTSTLSTAPTLMTPEMHAGEERAPATPSLPDATTVAMPAVRRFPMAAFIPGKAASHSAWVVYSPVPMLRLTAAMSTLSRIS